MKSAENVGITKIFGLPTAQRSVLLLLIAVAAAAASLLAPTNSLPNALRVGAPLVSAGLVLFGAIRNRSDRIVAWLLMSGSLLALSGAHLIELAVDSPGRALGPSFADVVHLLSWAGMFLAATMLTRTGRNERSSFGMFEVVIVTIAAGVGVWLLVIEPSLAAGEVSASTIVWAGSIPLLGGLAFAAAVRMAANAAFQSFPLVAIMSGFGLQLLADVARTNSEMTGQFDSGSLLAALGVLGVLVVGIAAFDPQIALESRERPVGVDLGVGRTIGLSVAVLTPLTVLLALTISGLGTVLTMVMVAVSSVVSVVFALARMWGLLDVVQVLTERRGEDRLAAMVEHSSDVVVLVDETGDIKYASPGLSSALGHRSDDWIGRPLIDLIASDDREAAGREFWRLFNAGPDTTVRFESSLVRVDGEQRRMEATFANLIGGDAVDGIVATFRDVTEQRDLEQKLSHRAYHDELTGLANRAMFLDRVDHALRVTRPDTDPVVVLFVDLDDFKGVNDSLGHGVGDQLLRTIADRIRDVVGSGDTPARLGGDELAVLLEDRGGVDRALELAQNMLDRLREPAHLAGHDIAVLASVGVAVAAPGMNTSSLLRDADIAMYEAKRAGKGQIKIFDPAMRLGASTQLEYRSELDQALENGQLRLVFQPLIDLRNGEVVGAEALVRWRHPTRGDVPPSEFIPVAERSGLIRDIGNWVLHEAMREAARWQVRGPHMVSINVSVVQLRVDGFVEQVREALALTGMPADQVMLEITETVLVDQIDTASTQLVELRALGVGIAIDDFGSGGCAIAYLEKFPVDMVKIDHSLIDAITGVPEPANLSRMILNLTASMGITSVAEGIERPEQIVALRQVGCDAGQGNLMSPPLEVDVLSRRFGIDDGSASLLVGQQ